MFYCVERNNWLERLCYRPPAGYNAIGKEVQIVWYYTYTYKNCKGFY